MTGTNGNSNVNSISRESQYNMESSSLLAAVGEMSLQFSLEQTKEDIRDQTLFITCGGGGGHLIFGRTKGGISRNWEPNRGDCWKLWKDSEGGPLKFAWKMKTWGKGIAKVIKSY